MSTALPLQGLRECVWEGKWEKYDNGVQVFDSLSEAVKKTANVDAFIDHAEAIVLFLLQFRVKKPPQRNRVAECFNILIKSSEWKKHLGAQKYKDKAQELQVPADITGILDALSRSPTGATQPTSPPSAAPQKGGMDERFIGIYLGADNRKIEITRLGNQGLAQAPGKPPISVSLEVSNGTIFRLKDANGESVKVKKVLSIANSTNSISAIEWDNGQTWRKQDQAAAEAAAKEAKARTAAAEAAAKDAKADSPKARSAANKTGTAPTEATRLPNGTQAEYFSTSRGSKWIPCVVQNFSNGLYILDVHSNAEPSKVRPKENTTPTPSPTTRLPTNTIFAPAGSPVFAPAPRETSTDTVLPQDQLGSAISNCVRVARSPKTMDNDGDEAFRSLEIASSQMKSPAAACEQEARYALEVWSFLLAYAAKNRNKMHRVSQVAERLKNATSWSSALQDRLRSASVDEQLHACFFPGAEAPEDLPVGSKVQVTAGLPGSFLKSGSKAIENDEPDVEPECGDFLIEEDCQLYPKEGSFLWVRRSNHPSDRDARLKVAGQTLAASTKGSYVIDKVRVQIRHVKDMMDGTQFVLAGDAESVLRGRSVQNKERCQFFRHAPGQVAPVALERTSAGHQVALVNAASAYSIGGGFVRGGRHALEESICTQSTLFQSLVIAETRAKEKGLDVRPPPWITDGSWQCHIPVDGAVLSPSVEFFRAGSDEGYVFQKEAVKVCAVVAIAMPNCNPRMRDCPVDAPQDKSEYVKMLEAKCRAMCTAAVASRATVLVVPDAGCGVYGNAPEDVGAALGRVIKQQFLKTFKEVHLVGLPEFQQAAEAAACGTVIASDSSDGKSTQIQSGVASVPGGL